MDVGSALATIRNEKLYRKDHGGGFDTFEDYCKSRWSMSDRRARQLIDAAEIVGEIGTVVPKHLTDSMEYMAQTIRSANERQVRPLSALPAADRPAAW
ncbi:MAG: hypothetical protein NTW19_02755, partial [Planctomycetota bacterium]|nr:hypothetical protein [Planctomycetota bacterium]